MEYFFGIIFNDISTITPSQTMSKLSELCGTTWYLPLQWATKQRPRVQVVTAEDIGWLWYWQENRYSPSAALVGRPRPSRKSLRINRIDDDWWPENYHVRKVNQILKKKDQIWFARGYIGMISAAMCSKAWVALRTLPQCHMKLRLAWPCVPDAFRYVLKIHQDVHVWVHPSL